MIKRVLALIQGNDDRDTVFRGQRCITHSRGFFDACDINNYHNHNLEQF